MSVAGAGAGAAVSVAGAGAGLASSFAGGGVWDGPQATREKLAKNERAMHNTKSFFIRFTSFLLVFQNLDCALAYTFMHILQYRDQNKKIMHL